ncbi:MAG: hypothetical protein E7J16_05615 [Gemella haemolysans]|nr:hypothetical protein [Gemella haemolysans]
MVLGIQLGNLAEWINIIVVSLLTWYFYRKDNRKTWKLYKNIEFKRIFPEKGVEIVTDDKILVISCYNNGKLPIFIEVNKVVRRKRCIFNKCSKTIAEYEVWSKDFDIDKNKKIKIMPSAFNEIYKVDLKLVFDFYKKNKSKLKSCEDFYFCIEELEGKRKYIKINDIFEK